MGCQGDLEVTHPVFKDHGEFVQFFEDKNETNSNTAGAPIRFTMYSFEKAAESDN